MGVVRMKVVRLILALSIIAAPSCKTRSGDETGAAVTESTAESAKAEETAAMKAKGCIDPKDILEVTFLSDLEVPEDPDKGSYGSISYREPEGSKTKSIWGTSWLCPAGESKIAAQIPADCSFTYFESQELRCDYVKTEEGLMLQDEVF